LSSSATPASLGNNAVHPGQIDLRDDRQAAYSLFSIVNVIVEAMISQPKHIDDMYSKLPQEARDKIEKRDFVTRDNGKTT
jgi:hypothetical protein